MVCLAVSLSREGGGLVDYGLVGQLYLIAADGKAGRIAEVILTA